MRVTVGLGAGGFVGVTDGVGVAEGVAVAVAVTVGVTLGDDVDGVGDGVWLVLGDVEPEAVGSSSEQALSARVASSIGTATRVRRADRVVPAEVMTPTVTGVTDVTRDPTVRVGPGRARQGR